MVAAFDVRMVELPPGVERASHEAEWRDALVVVGVGEIELECRNGTTHRFARGDLLCLTGLSLRALHNRGDEPALLVAVSRREPDAAGARPSGDWERSPDGP